MSQFKPKKEEKEVISLRIATDLIQELDEKANLFDMSRNELIIQSIRFALDNINKDDLQYLIGEVAKNFATAPSNFIYIRFLLHAQVLQMIFLPVSFYPNEHIFYMLLSNPYAPNSLK